MSIPAAALSCCSPTITSAISRIFENKKTYSAATLWFLLVTLLTTYGCVGLTSSSKIGLGAPGSGSAVSISVAPDSISFGSVPVGSHASQSITISNRGGSEVTITKAGAKGAGVKIKGISLPLVIGPGKQATFEVVYSPKVPGLLSGNVTILSNLSKSPKLVSLKGMGMAATAFLTASTPNLSFGDISLGKSGAQAVTLTNVGNSDVTVSKVTVQGASYRASGVSAGLILAPGQSATLQAWFSPRATGASAGSLTVASNASNSPQTISLMGDGGSSGSHSVMLTWVPSVSVVAGYNVYRSETFGGPYSKLGAAAVPSNEFTDSSVQPGLTYYYVITSIAPGGIESADSVQASAIIPSE